MRSWLDFEERFRQLAPALQYLRLDFQWGSAGEYWRVCGMPTSPTVRQFEALARLVGLALIDCASRYQQIEELVAAEKIPENSWFRALKELSGDFKSALPDRELDEDGKIVSPVSWQFGQRG